MARVQDLLETPFSSRIHAEKLKIVNVGKPKPALHNLECMHKEKKGEYTRRFTASQYETVEWLTGCEVLSKLFCWSCLLFSREKGVWNKQGYSDLNHLTSAIQKHERSQTHVQAFLDYRMFGQQRLDSLIETERKAAISRHNEQVKKNREILKRIIDAVCYLSQQELPFQSLESNYPANRGNYLELLDLLREYDSLLNTHLSTSTVFQGNSETLQTNIIEAISHVIINHIKSEISSASFIAVILDETSDVMSKSQLSTVLRFVHKGKVYERFIGFSDVCADRTSQGLFRHLVGVVEDFHIQDKLVSQSYNGASVMSEHLNGLQSKVLDEYPFAIFTHCYAHALNLVLQQGLGNIKECRIFFQSLIGLASFFSKSSKQVHALQEFVARRLPSTEPARWNFTSHLSGTVQKYRLQLIDFFQNILDNSEEWDSNSVVKAQGFMSFLQQFQTIFLLGIFSKLFDYSYVLYQVIESKMFDVPYCCEKIKEILKLLRHERDHGFENLWLSAISTKGGNEDKNCKKIRLTEDDEIKSYLQLYENIVDTFSVQIECRFSSLSKLEFFQLLWYERYEEYKIKFPDHLITKLKDFYGTLFDYIRLRNELIVLYTCPEFSQKTVHKLIEFIVEKNLASGLKEVFRLGELILTIPVNTASVENTFSVLDRIKLCVHGLQNQERHSLLSIEKSLLMQLKQRGLLYDEVIEQFTSQRKRIELTFK